MGGQRQVIWHLNRNFAVSDTGFPIKRSGDVPPDMTYLNSPVVAGLENFSNDINLAARNAIAGIVDCIVATYSYDRQQAPSTTMLQTAEGRIAALKPGSKCSFTPCKLRFFARFCLALHPLIDS
ncbi:MAG: hypothetical protein RQ899_06310 [Pseudomonadales bacterium]|nr:hypothetical protein [Pseudomonadales bacterium]